MRRTIVIAADLSGAALDDLKAWLGITRSNEDATLVDLLNASLQICEAFIGQIPLQVTFEESLSARAGYSRLSSRPVQSVLSVKVLANDGTRSAFDAQNYEVEFDASANACVQIKTMPVSARAVLVSAVAGLSPDWASLPAPLRQGIIRLAAYYYRDLDRERADDPPSSVGALWRPWRDISLT